MLNQETTNAPLNYLARTVPGIVIATAPTKIMETIEVVIV